MVAIVYQLRVKGHLPPAWAGEFAGLALRCEADGCTSLTGSLPDQAALHGLLARIRDLGLELLSVHQLSTAGDGDPGA
jgi:hypothetical protein